MRVVNCRMEAPCHHLLPIELCTRTAGRNERLFLAGHSAGGQISADYAQRLAGGLILLARALHRRFLDFCAVLVAVFLIWVRESTCASRL